MEEERYKNREIDHMHDILVQQVSGVGSDVKSVRKEMLEMKDGLYQRLDYTNGKVKKIIIALVALGAFSLGLGIKEAGTLIAFLL